MKKIILAFIAFATVNTAYSQTEEQLRSLDSTRKFLATTDFIYPYIDTPPGYIGGTEKWQNYQRTSPVLKDAIRKAKEQRIPAGKYSINIRFSVNPDGSVSDVKAINKKVGYGLEEAAIKFISESGQWLPANIEGEYLKTTVHVPINFTVSYK